MFNPLQPSLHISLIDKDQQNSGTWRERLNTWKEILGKDKLKEDLESLNAKYVVEFDMKEVENSLRKDVVEKVPKSKGTRALWISKRWWRYRPKLPYTYFLQKLDSSEVKLFLFTPIHLCFLSSSVVINVLLLGFARNSNPFHGHQI